MTVATATVATKPAVVTTAVIAATIDRRRINLNTAIGRIAATVVAAAITAIIRLAKTSAVTTTEIVVAVAVVNGNSEPRATSVTLCHRI